MRTSSQKVRRLATLIGGSLEVTFGWSSRKGVTAAYCDFKYRLSGGEWPAPVRQVDEFRMNINDALEDIEEALNDTGKIKVKAPEDYKVYYRSGGFVSAFVEVPTENIAPPGQSLEEKRIAEILRRALRGSGFSVNVRTD